MSKDKGILFVISGPSGVGKGTVLKRVCENLNNISVNVSATTRKPRCGEIDGVSYNFITENEFRELIKSDGLLEYVEALDCCYGTPKKPVFDKLENGEDVILEIETTGANNVRKKAKCVSIFIAPPSMKELEKRLLNRKTESPEQVQKRINKCMSELPCAKEYDYVLVNDNLDECVNIVSSIIIAERCKVSKNKELVEKIIGLKGEY